jgi:hypothetical protein
VTWRTNLGSQFDALDRKKIIAQKRGKHTFVPIQHLYVPISFNCLPSFPVPVLLKFGLVVLCIGDPENNILGGSGGSIFRP